MNERFLKLLCEQVIRDLCYSGGTLAGSERMQRHLGEYISLIEKFYTAGHQPTLMWPAAPPETKGSKGEEV
jgi:hypothetical protein